MRREEIRKILEGIKKGKISVKEGMEKLKYLPFLEVEKAKIDTHRTLRRGYPEVIFSQGKTPSQVVEIARGLWEVEKEVICTRASSEVFEFLKREFPQAKYYPEARIIWIGKRKRKLNPHPILIISGGTSDLPVAEEAAVICEIMGNKVERLYDVGVAGIHRLLAYRKKLAQAKVIVVIAGMEGALPGVVAGMVDKPVIAVPTSVGYGVSLGGLSALFTMLSSCSPGVGVVNIDNGFGAGYLASLINQGKEE